jgi:hypothetical protein
MARLRNTTTGAVVEVRDEKVALLGSGWEDATSEKSAPQRRTKKADEKSAE